MYVLYNKKNDEYLEFKEKEAISALRNDPENYQTVDEYPYILRNITTGDFKESRGIDVTKNLGDGYEISTNEAWATSDTARWIHKEKSKGWGERRRQELAGFVKGATAGLVDPDKLRFGKQTSLEKELERERLKSGHRTFGEVAGTFAGLGKYGVVGKIAKGATKLGKVGKTLAGKPGQIIGEAAGWGLGYAGATALGKATEETLKEQKVSDIMKNVLGVSAKEGAETAVGTAIALSVLPPLGKAVGLAGRGVGKTYQFLQKAPQALREGFFGVKDSPQRAEKLASVFKEYGQSPDRVLQVAEENLNKMSKDYLDILKPVTTKQEAQARLLLLERDLGKKLEETRKGFEKNLKKFTDSSSTSSLLNILNREKAKFRGLSAKQTYKSYINFLDDAIEEAKTAGMAGVRKHVKQDKAMAVAESTLEKKREGLKKLTSSITKQKKDVKDLEQKTASLNRLRMRKKDALDKINVERKNLHREITDLKKEQSTIANLTKKQHTYFTGQIKTKGLRLNKLGKDLKNLPEEKVALNSMYSKLSGNLTKSKKKLQDLLSEQKRLTAARDESIKEVEKVTKESIRSFPPSVTTPLRTIMKEASDKAHFNKRQGDKAVSKAFSRLYGKVSNLENKIIDKGIMEEMPKVNVGMTFEEVELWSLRRYKRDYHRVKGMSDIIEKSLGKKAGLNYYRMRDIMIAGGGAYAFGLEGAALAYLGALAVQQSQRTGWKYLQTATRLEKMFGFMNKTTSATGLKWAFKKGNKAVEQLEKDSTITPARLFYIMTGRKFSPVDFDIRDYGSEDYYLHDGDQSSLMEDYGGLKNANEYWNKNMQAKQMIASLAPKGFTDRYGKYHPPDKPAMDRFMQTINQGFSYPQFVKAVRNKTLSNQGLQLAMQMYPEQINKFSMAITEGMQNKELAFNDYNYYIQLVAGLNSNKRHLLYESLSAEVKVKNEPALQRKLENKKVYDPMVGTASLS